MSGLHGAGFALPARLGRAGERSDVDDRHFCYVQRLPAKRALGAIGRGGRSARRAPDAFDLPCAMIFYWLAWPPGVAPIQTVTSANGCKRGSAGRIACTAHTTSAARLSMDLAHLVSASPWGVYFLMSSRHSSGRHRVVAATGHLGANPWLLSAAGVASRQRFVQILDRPRSHAFAWTRRMTQRATCSPHANACSSAGNDFGHRRFVPGTRNSSIVASGLFTRHSTGRGLRDRHRLHLCGGHLAIFHARAPRWRTARRTLRLQLWDVVCVRWRSRSFPRHPRRRAACG